MRYLALVLPVFGCGFRSPVGAVSDATSDAPSALFCAADPRLRLCYSFDQESLPAALPDEGAAAVEAQLTNVTRIARGSGGAALLDTASSIFVPMTSEVTNIQAIEIWYRADADPPNGGRSGLVDSNVSPPNISLFLIRQDPGHQLRCERPRGRTDRRVALPAHSKVQVPGAGRDIRSPPASSDARGG